MNKNYAAYLMLIGATFFWSTNFILGKFLTDIPPLLIGTARFTVAFLIFLPSLWRSRSSLPKGPVLWAVLAMGFTGIFLFNPMLYFGLHYTTSINATMLNAFTPLVVAVMSHFWLKEKLNKSKSFGLTLSILGIIFIAAQGSVQHLIELRLNPGDLIIILSTVIWALYTLLIKVTSNRMNPTQGTGLAMLAGLLFLIPATIIQGTFAPLPSLSLRTLSVLIYLGVFPSVVSFLLWNTAVHKVGPSVSGMFNNFIPIFNVILATQFLHEQLYSYHIIGFLLVFSGVLIAGGLLNASPTKTEKVSTFE